MYQHEPISKMAIAVGLGVVSALTIIGYSPFIPEFDHSTLFGALADAFLSAAIPEEIVKLTVLWLFLRNLKEYDERIDGVVYATCVGLGFAGIENFLYLCNAEDWVSVGIMRALMSVPGHFFFAVFMGYFYSLVHFDKNNNRSLNMACTLLVPIIIHGIYDACLMAMEVSVPIALGCTVILLTLMIVTFKFALKGMKEHLEIDHVQYMRKKMPPVPSRHATPPPPPGMTPPPPRMTPPTSGNTPPPPPSR